MKSPTSLIALKARSELLKLADFYAEFPNGGEVVLAHNGYYAFTAPFLLRIVAAHLDKGIKELKEAEEVSDLQNAKGDKIPTQKEIRGEMKPCIECGKPTDTTMGPKMGYGTPICFECYTSEGKIVAAKPADSYTNGVDPVDNMTPEEVKDMCHFLAGVSWSDYCAETLIGCIIKTFKEWKCDLHIKPSSDPMRSYVVKLVFYPTEFEITAPSLEKAFVKTGHVLGKWKLGPIEPPKPPENAL